MTINVMSAVIFDSLFLGLLLLLFTLQRPLTLAAAGVLCALYALARSNRFVFDFKVLICALLVALALMVSVIVGRNHGFSSLFYLFSTFSAFYAARRFGSFPLSHVRLCLEVVFWLGVLGIFFALILHWGSPEPMGEVVPGSSTNGLPSYLIVLQVALAISVILEKGRLPLWSAFATFLVALLGLGRGSIVISAMLLAFSVFSNIFLVSWAWKRAWVRLGLIALLILLFGTGIYFWQTGTIETQLKGTKWAWGVLDPPRAKMLGDYVRKLNWQSILVGADYGGTSIETIYLNNPHNSYIRLHSCYGLIGILLVTLSPFSILMSNRRAVVKNSVFILVLLVLVRAATEPILFPTALDFFYFLYFTMFWKPVPSRSAVGNKSC